MKLYYTTKKTNAIAVRIRKKLSRIYMNKIRMEAETSDLFSGSEEFNHHDIEITGRVYKDLKELLSMFEVQEVRKPKIYPFEHIEKKVCSFYKDIDLRENTRKREVVELRQLCHYFGKLYTKYPLAEIGFYFGRKDHATVMNSIKTIKNRIDTEKDFAKKVKQIENSITNNY